MKPTTYLTILITISILIFISILIQRFKRWLKKRKQKKRKHISEEVRGLILEEANNECILCKSNTSLEIHHRDSIPSNNKLDNLIVLCHDCHRKQRMNI